MLIGLVVSAHGAEPSRIAIVIDDLGYRTDMDRAALALDARIAVAVIPGAPGAHAVSLAAAGQGRDVLIHLPLPHSSGDCEALACPNQDWSVDRIYTHLKWAAMQVPGAVGLSNHQGSKFTADPLASGRLIQALLRFKTQDERRLFLIDSRTSAHSQLAIKASQAGLAFAERQIFLDHDREPAAVERAWQNLLQRALKDGHALAIGHPHPETLELLNAAVPALAGSNVRLVRVSELLSGGPVSRRLRPSSELPKH